MQNLNEPSFFEHTPLDWIFLQFQSIYLTNDPGFSPIHITSKHRFPFMEIAQWSLKGILHYRSITSFSSVCVYACIQCIGMYMCMCICVYVYMSVCVYVYISICLYVYMSICLYVYVSICLYVYMSICLYVYVSICLCVYMSICLYVYMCIQYTPDNSNLQGTDENGSS